MNFNTYDHLKNSASRISHMLLKSGICLALLVGMTLVPVMANDSFGAPAGTAVSSTPQAFNGGYVNIVNRTSQTFWLCGTSYIDKAGTTRSLANPTWEIKPGANINLVLNDWKIVARKFDFWLSNAYGATGWFLGPGSVSDGELTLVIDGDFANRHYQRRQETLKAAAGKLFGALIAQGVGTSGDPREDTFGDAILRQIVLEVRNNLIREAVNDTFPVYSGSQRANIQRIIILMFDGRLNRENYNRETRRDAFLATLKRESPDLAGAVDVLDFLDRLGTLYANR